MLVLTGCKLCTDIVVPEVVHHLLGIEEFVLVVMKKFVKSLYIEVYLVVRKQLSLEFT